MKYKFITFEGVDGVGKTTQLELLKNYLEKSYPNYEIICSREPGGVMIAEQIRDLLVVGDKEKFLPLSSALLHTVARYEHYYRLILPKLKEGAIIICDRFFDSTLAYQHYGEGVSIEILEYLYKITVGDFKPDITFVLDSTSELLQKRIKNRKVDYEERYEQYSKDFYQRVRQGYLDIVEKNKDRCVIIKANSTIENIHKKVIYNLGI